MSARAGYSLLEVLIAFAIMSMTLAVVLPGQAQLFSRTAEADTRFLAADFAMSVLEQLGTSEPITVGRTVHTYKNWEVAIVVDEGSIADATALPVYNIEVTVSEIGGRFLAELNTVRPVP